jgi:hypothetical protein
LEVSKSADLYADLIAREVIPAGSLVYFDKTANGIKLATNIADAGGTKKALGFVNQQINNNDTGTVYFAGVMITANNVVPGDRYYLGTGGQPTNTAPTQVNETLQYVGTAVTTSKIVWYPEDGFIL